MKVYTVVSREVSTDDPKKALQEEENFAFKRFQRSAANREHEYEGSFVPDRVDEAYLKIVLED